MDGAFWKVQLDSHLQTELRRRNSLASRDSMTQRILPEPSTSTMRQPQDPRCLWSGHRLLLSAQYLWGQTFPPSPFHMVLLGLQSGQPTTNSSLRGGYRKRHHKNQSAAITGQPSGRRVTQGGPLVSFPGLVHRHWEREVPFQLMLLNWEKMNWRYLWPSSLPHKDSLPVA